jgi:hypothetical protein
MKKIIAGLISLSLLTAPFAFADTTDQATTDQTVATATADTSTAKPAKKNCHCKSKHKKHKKSKKAKEAQPADATTPATNDQAAPAPVDQPAAQ